MSLKSSQLHGDRDSLVNNSDCVELHIRTRKRKGSQSSFNKPKKSSTKSNGETSSGIVEGDHRWRVCTGTHFPDPEQSTPTLYGDRVYTTIHHAVLACLLWFSGGISKHLKYSFCPRVPRVWCTHSTRVFHPKRPASSGDFPLVEMETDQLENLIPIKLDSETTNHNVALHVLSKDPSHRDLLTWGLSILVLSFLHDSPHLS